ncbi:carcinoembryonic antigen-related cell adhesion molecule 1-like isoform X5 [Triplophysa rosa]|uniref:carcinoembryonic antigen-related cell adhesion molecule 1-like isoform X5 n=1 Tax=Triplophysa rosa TaxID=992332 RepID=UPI0025461EE6|nr:carcinoembryonic antigen-related cell adhesion molecule 1-like isoform X5 [Triplophysa rosa]
MEISSLLLALSLISNVHFKETKDIKPTLTVQPQSSLFTGDNVNLNCEVDQSTGWEFTFINSTNHEHFQASGTKTISSVRVSDAGEYKCRARRGENPQNYTQYSEPITLTVEERPKAEVSVRPDEHVFRGETVTLTCVINGETSVTSWQYRWNKDSFIQQNKQQNYTISSVVESHAGKYTCRGTEIRGSSDTSDAVTLTVSGVSSSVSLIIRPNRTQHFSSESLSLSCEDHRNSTGWTVRRYTNTLETCPSSSVRSTGTESTCTITSLITSDTGVYWCESESGHKLHPVNISIHNGDVILDSPVHPVTEGDSLTLHCLYRDKNPSNLRAEFYKDGSEVQNQTTGDMMIISTVSKSHEGFYSCQHPERGASPKRWISVTASGDFEEKISVLKILSSLLAVCPYLIVTVVLVFKCYRLRVDLVEDQRQYAVREDETSI